MTPLRALVLFAPLSLVLPGCMTTPNNGDRLCGDEGSTISPAGYTRVAGATVTTQVAPTPNGPWTSIGSTTASTSGFPVDDSDGTVESFYFWSENSIRMTSSNWATEGSDRATYVRSQTMEGSTLYTTIDFNSAATSPNGEDWYTCTQKQFLAQGSQSWAAAANSCAVNETGVRITAPVVSTCASCPLSPTCPPNMYNTTPGGFTGAYTTSTNPILPVGCSYAAPALSACQTAPGTNPVWEPAPALAVMSSVVIGGNTVYGVGAPRTPLSGSDNRTAVYAWGDNSTYQLGNGTTEASTTPQVPVFVPGVPVTQIAAGEGDACALLANGVVECWGTIETAPNPVRNTTAKPMTFGTGVTIAAITHGAHHACALSTEGDVYCWGNSSAGQLGRTIYSVDDPTNLSGYRSYVGVPLLVDVAYTASGSSWGARTPPLQAPGVVSDVVASGDSTCVLAQGVPNGSEDPQVSVYCWGDDTMGSLGDAPGNPHSFGDQTVYAAINALDQWGGVQDIVSLTGGSSSETESYGSFCAKTKGDISDAAEWYCWGADDHGQIDVFPVPLGPSAGGAAPTPPFEPDTSSPPQNISPLDFADSFSLGVNHSCAQLSSATFCFGDNDNGQLGLPASTTTQGVPVVSTELNSSDYAYPYSSVAVGETLSCGIRSDLRVIECWGTNNVLRIGAYIPTPLNW